MHDESVRFKRRRSTGLQRRSLTWLPLKLAGAYFVIAALWILSSDFWLGTLVSHPDSLTSFQSIKGLLFVSVTTLVLYGLLRRSLRVQQQAATMLRESEERLRLILQNMPVMLGAFDDQNNMILWNHE
ncbi:MAG TPA: hypothetical protein V6C50_14650, partial [Crinalium sp.]